MIYKEEVLTSVVNQEEPEEDEEGEEELQDSDLEGIE
jgi:hypothetical protein